MKGFRESCLEGPSCFTSERAGRSSLAFPVWLEGLETWPWGVPSFQPQKHGLTVLPWETYLLARSTTARLLTAPGRDSGSRSSYLSCPLLPASCSWDVTAFPLQSSEEGQQSGPPFPTHLSRKPEQKWTLGLLSFPDHYEIKRLRPPREQGMHLDLPLLETRTGPVLLALRLRRLLGRAGAAWLGSEWDESPCASAALLGLLLCPWSG